MYVAGCQGILFGSEIEGRTLIWSSGGKFPCRADTGHEEMGGTCCLVTWFSQQSYFFTYINKFPC